MAIIKKFASFQNLSNFQTFIRDSEPNSQYFRISEFKETFTGGKNGFLIEGSEFLKESTDVKIEILDVAGNPIYFEPGDGVPEYYEGIAKLVSVHIYDDTPIGIGKITILGELKTYIDNFGATVPIPSEWAGVYNVKWEKSFQINKNLNNESIVRFYRRPEATIEELIKPIFSKSVPTVTDTGYVHGISEVPNSGTDIRNWRAGTTYKLIRTSGSWDRDVDENTITISNPSHTARIIEVLNDREVLVDIPYTIDNFVSNFTSGSYSVSYSDFANQVIGESTLTGSFAKINITNLKTFVGDVARVKVFRKSRNAVGDFQFVQESKLESTELLRDITTTSDTELSYGLFDEYNLSRYWVTSSNDHPVTINSSTLSQAVKVDYNGSGVQQLITSESFSISKDVEYTLNFRTLLSGSLSDSGKSVRAFFSSSNFTQDFVTISGSAIYRTRQNVSQNILSENTGDAKLVFEFEGDDWYISNVSLKNAQDTSFSPDEFTLIQDIPRKLASETFDFRFEFYDINNNYIPVDVGAVGVFDGGNDFPTNGKLLTFESDRNAFRFSSGSIANPYNQVIKFSLTQNNLTGSATFESSAFDVDGNYLEPSDYSQYPGKLTNITTAGALLSLSNFTGSRIDGLTIPYVGSVVYTASLENLQEFETVYRLEDGDNAPQIIVTSNANQFIYEPTALEPKPSGQSITIRAQRKNLASLVTPLTINKSDSNGPDLNYVDTVGGIDTYTLSAIEFSASFSANSFDEITYSFTGSDVFDNEQYDEITISKVINFDGVSITLSNESTAFRANGQGVVLDDFTSGDGNVEVRIGNKIIEHENGLITPNTFDITGSVPINVTEKDELYTSDEYGVTALTQDSGSVILNIKYLAGDGVTTQSFNKKVNYTKNRIAQPSITFDTTNKTQNVDAKSTGVQLTDFDDSTLTIREFYTGSVTTFASGDIDLVITSGSDDSTGNPLVTRSGLTLSFGDLPDGVNSTQIGLTATLTDSEGFGREVSDTISLSKTLASAPNIEFQVTPSAQTLTSNSVGGSPGSATNLVVTANEGGSVRTITFPTLPTANNGVTITSATDGTGVIVLNTSAMSADTSTVTISARATNTEGTDVTKTLTATVSKAKTAQPSITFSATPQAQTIDAKSTGELVGSITDVVISGFEGNTPLTYNQVTSLGVGQYKITNVTGVTVSDTTPNTATNGTIDITGFSGDSAVGTASISYKDSEGTPGTSSIKFTLAKAKAAAPAVLVTATPQSQNVSANELGTQTGTLTDVVVSVENGTFVDMTKTQSGFGTNPTISTNTLTMSSAIMNAAEASVTLTVNYTDTEDTGGSQDIIIRCTKTNDGSIGANGVVINLSPTSQIVKRSTSGTYDTPSIFTVTVSENGELLTHTTNATLLDNQFKIGTITNGSISAGSGTTTPDITPTTPSLVTGLTTSFTITYKDSQGNESDALPQSHRVSVVLDGVTGPGVVHTGVWKVDRIYQYDDGLLTGTGRRDTVLWSSDGNAPYDTYYASTRTHTSVGTNTINGAPHQSNSTAWVSLGTQDFFVAAKLGVFEESFIQDTLNIGTNNSGGVSAANITLYGGGAYPYFSLGQATAGTYGGDGIYIGNDSGTYKASFVNGTTSFLKWTGTGLEIKGSITVTGGDAATQTQAQGYANTAQSNAITAAENYTDGIVESVSIATMNLTLSSNMEITNGRELKRTGGTTWAEQVYSGIGFKDGAFISFKNSTANVNANYMVGLNSDPTTNASYTSLDYAWYVRQGNTYDVRVNGSVVTPDVTLPSVADGDVLAIFYDGSSVKWYRNNTLYNTVSAANGLNLYLDSSFNTNTTTPCISWFEFGPAGQTNSSSKTDGEVGGWTIDSSAIYSGVKDVDGFTDASTGGITISATSGGSIHSRKFYIDTNGNAFFKGDVTGANGNFAGKITAGSMVLGNDAGGAGVAGIYIDANDYWYDDGNFSLGNGGVTWNGTTLTIAGSVKIGGTTASTVESGAAAGATANQDSTSTIRAVGAATSGTVGGWGIEQYKIKGGAPTVGGDGTFTDTGIILGINSSNNKGYISSQQFYISSSGDAIFSGTVSAGSIEGGQININNNFTVDSLGNMNATNANISGIIDSDEATLGAWLVDVNAITAQNGDITLNATDGYIYLKDSGVTKVNLNTNSTLSAPGAGGTVGPSSYNAATKTDTKVLSVDGYGLGGNTTYQNITSFAPSVGGNWNLGYAYENGSNTYVTAAGLGCSSTLNVYLDVLSGGYTGTVEKSTFIAGETVYGIDDSGQSVEQHTDILLDGGVTKQAKDVNTNDVLLVWDEISNSFVKTTVSKIRKKTNKLSYEVVVGDYTILVSDSHGFWLDGGDEIKVGDIKPNETKIYVKDGDGIKLLVVNEVNRIEGNEKVFITFEIPIYHNYVSNNIISHNVIGDGFPIEETDYFSNRSGNLSFNATASTTYYLRLRYEFNWFLSGTQYTTNRDAGYVANFDGQYYGNSLNAGTEVNNAGLQVLSGETRVFRADTTVGSGNAWITQIGGTNVDFFVPKYSHDTYGNYTYSSSGNTSIGYDKKAFPVTRAMCMFDCASTGAPTIRTPRLNVASVTRSQAGIYIVTLEEGLGAGKGVPMVSSYGRAGDAPSYNPTDAEFTNNMGAKHNTSADSYTLGFKDNDTNTNDDPYTVYFVVFG
jgi:hypothetical protein